MNILMIVDTPMTFFSGIWWHRNETPKRALGKRGHSVKVVAIGNEMAEDMMEWADVAIFGRTYPQQYNPVKLMTELKKRGTRILYDMDDDHWLVAKDNPSVLVSNALKDQYEDMIAEADAIITPSKVLAKKFKRYFKKDVFICPNGIDFEEYQPRRGQHDDLIIGYMGAASHWKDLQVITPALRELSKKYDFLFSIYGMVGEPLEAAIYTYKKILQNKFQPEKAAYHQSAMDFYNSLEGLRMYHIPFMPPELHPKTLSACDFDIAIAPLEDNEFNSGKSCIKYYEYASTGTVTLASDVMPYSDEVSYRAKNTTEDWYNKLEKLIVNKQFREEELKKQQKWVFENRSLDAIGLDWELALQKKSKWGLKVLNQSR